MNHRALFTQLTLTLITAAAAIGASACVGQPPGEGEEVGTVLSAVGGSQCRNYQAGVVGYAADASIWQSAPTYSSGNHTELFTGTSSAGFKQTLLYFDISNVPAGAHVDSATLALYMSWKEDGSTVGVHEVLAPWDESTVTWANFDGSFDPVASTSFLAWGGGGTLGVHIEGLVQPWVNGASDNHGFLLQDDGRTSFHSGEHAVVAHHPKLRICYTVQ